MVSTVSQSQHFTRILIWAAEGISAFNVALFQTFFQKYFLERKLVYFDKIFIEICSPGSNWQYSSIGSDNGLAPTRRQTIIWTNDG